MAKGKLFEYAVIFHPKPTKEEREAGTTPKSELIADLTSVLARDEKEVGIIAARAIPEKFTDRLDDIEIVVRPL